MTGTAVGHLATVRCLGKSELQGSSTNALCRLKQWSRFTSSTKDPLPPSATLVTLPSYFSFTALHCPSLSNVYPPPSTPAPCAASRSAAGRGCYPGTTGWSEILRGGTARVGGRRGGPFRGRNAGAGRCLSHKAHAGQHRGVLRKWHQSSVVWCSVVLCCVVYRRVASC